MSAPPDPKEAEELTRLVATMEEARVDKKMAFHWDGLQTDLREVLLSSALGDGATPKSLPLDPLAKLQQWLETLPPPKFEDLFPVDHALAQTGEPIYRQRCARCHAMDGERTGQVIALTDEAWSEGVDPGAPRPRYTDNHRALMWTPRRRHGLQQLRVKISLGLPALPLDRWLRERAARRPVDSRAVSAQRIGAVPRRAVRNAGQTDEGVPPRARRSRSAAHGFCVRRPGGRAGRHDLTTPLRRETATRVISGALS